MYSLEIFHGTYICTFHGRSMECDCRVKWTIYGRSEWTINGMPLMECLWMMYGLFNLRKKIIFLLTHTSIYVFKTTFLKLTQTLSKNPLKIFLLFLISPVLELTTAETLENPSHYPYAPNPKIFIRSYFGNSHISIRTSVRGDFFYFN